MRFLSSCTPKAFLSSDDKTTWTTVTTKTTETDCGSALENSIFVTEDLDTASANSSTNNSDSSILNQSISSTSVSTMTGNVPSPVESTSSDTSASATSVEKMEQSSTARTSAPAPRNNSMALKPGETSPSSLTLNRNMSAGIATDPSNTHPILDGRPIIVPENLTLGGVTISSNINNSGHQQSNTSNPISNAKTSLLPESPFLARRVVFPKSPQSGPARPSSISDRSVSAAAALAITPPSLPFAQGTDNDDRTQERTNVSTSNGSIIVKSGPDCGGGRPQLHRSSSEHVKYDVSQDFILHPSPLRLDAWSEPAAETFSIRSKTYLNDKVKEPSQSSAFHLLAVDLVQVPKNGKPYYHGLCSHPSERIQQALRRERETGIPELPPFVFAVNLVVPGQVVYHNVFYFGCDAATLTDIKQATSPFGKLMNRFVYAPTDSEDENTFRDDTFKLIPRIVDGNFIVRKAVGSKPAVLGKKIVQKYVRDPSPDPRFFEIMVDIASDTVAQRIVKLALGYTKTMTVDMAFCLEGQHPATLPERIFGVVRMKNIDFKEKDGKRVLVPPSTSAS